MSKRKLPNTSHRPVKKHKPNTLLSYFSTTSQHHKPQCKLPAKPNASPRDYTNTNASQRDCSNQLPLIEFHQISAVSKNINEERHQLNSILKKKVILAPPRKSAKKKKKRRKIKPQRNTIVSAFTASNQSQIARNMYSQYGKESLSEYYW